MASGDGVEVWLWCDARERGGVALEYEAPRLSGLEVEAAEEQLDDNGWWTGDRRVGVRVGPGLDYHVAVDGAHEHRLVGGVHLDRHRSALGGMIT